MDDQELRERQMLVAEALTWERTPFHDCANLKGVGVDCANVLYEVPHALGLVPDFTIPHYTPQFLLHSERELFLEIVELFCRPVTDRSDLPGDIRMWKYGKCFSHGAIVIAPGGEIIHARKSAGFVVRGNVRLDVDLMYEKSGRPRPTRLYTLKRWT